MATYLALVTIMVAWGCLVLVALRRTESSIKSEAISPERALLTRP